MDLLEFRHITDFHSPQPEKELVKWLMDEMLKYQLTIGWYSKGVKLNRKKMELLKVKILT